MRTLTTRSLLVASCMFAILTSVQAIQVPTREVRIRDARFAQLSLMEQQQVLDLKDRLDVIIATDQTSLDKAHRLELRKEWRSLKAEMKQANRNGSVIYISTAGLIIIILLLIIIF
jgi:hypothetical protein